MAARTVGRIAVAAQRSDTRHAWQRWADVWHVVFAVLLGVVAALQDPAVTPGPVLGPVGRAGGLVRVEKRTAATADRCRADGRALRAWLLWFALIWLHVAFVPVGAFLAAHVCSLSLAWAVPVAAAFVGGSWRVACWSTTA